MAPDDMTPSCKACGKRLRDGEDYFTVTYPARAVNGVTLVDLSAYHLDHLPADLPGAATIDRLPPGPGGLLRLIGF